VLAGGVLAGGVTTGMAAGVCAGVGAGVCTNNSAGCGHCTGPV